MVADKIDMSLDDIIAGNKRGRGRGGRSGGRGFSGNRRASRNAGPIRRGSGGRGGRGGNFRGGARNTPYNRPQNTPDKWEHDMYDGTGAQGAQQGDRVNRNRRTEGLSTGTHLQISNLDFGVTDTDIKELFSEFGKLKKAIINYDESGRSHGTADVVFERKADALKAFNTYDNVPLDGRAMKIEAVTPTVTTVSSTSTSSGRRDSWNSSGNRSRGNTRGSIRGNRGGNRGRGRGRGRGSRREAPSKDDLDRELDSYIESAS